MNRYRITLRNGTTFELDSENNLHDIVDRITVTPATINTAPFWVFDTTTAIWTADIVAIELMTPPKIPQRPPRNPSTSAGG